MLLQICLPLIRNNRLRLKIRYQSCNKGKQKKIDGNVKSKQNGNKFPTRHVKQGMVPVIHSKKFNPRRCTFAVPF
jgi:hypothetical protein